MRLRTASASPGRYLASAEGLIDLAAASALPFGWLLAPDPHDAPLFAVVWTLRYIRHTTGLALFWRIMRRSRTQLLSIASLFLVVFLIASTSPMCSSATASPRPSAACRAPCGGRS